LQKDCLRDKFINAETHFLYGISEFLRDLIAWLRVHIDSESVRKLGRRARASLWPEGCPGAAQAAN
jgi:hypothetical protein